VSVSVSSTSLLSKHLKIYATDSGSFLRLARKKNHDLFVIFMRNIDKALKITSFVDSVTLLFLEYHDFLDVFSRELMNILPERRLCYDPSYAPMLVAMLVAMLMTIAGRSPLGYRVVPRPTLFRVSLCSPESYR